MKQYVSRRTRCWKLLQELDPEIQLSEGHRADLLLDLSGLDKNERTMVQASIRNLRIYEKVAQALIVQRPRIHVNEKRREPSRKGKGKGRGHRSFGKGEGKYQRKAYIAEYDDASQG